MMLLVVGVGILSAFGSGNVNAVSSSITLSIDNASIGVDVVPQGGGGTFVKSGLIPKISCYLPLFFQRAH